jgi:acetyl esterase
VPLDPQVQAIRDRLEREGRPNLAMLPIEEARAAEAAMARAASAYAEPVGKVADLRIPGPAGERPARIYWPKDGTHPGGWPLLVYFFGGGWSLGTLDSPDCACRRLTNAAGCVTVSVGYRLAPEHRFPAAVEDCYAGTAWAASHAAELGADAGRLAVGGDSSGGNLAAAVALAARQRGGPAIVHQLLVYPNTDWCAGTASMRKGADPHFLNATAVRRYWGRYLASPVDGANPLASPLRADDLSGLPEATVLTAEFDPVRDEAEHYAQRLRAANVAVKVTRYPGMVHGFFTMPGILDCATVAVAEAADRLREAFTRL